MEHIKDKTMDDKIIKDAQYRKGLSIAYFNAINAAIELVKLEEHKSENDRKSRLAFWRDWLLEEHKSYYANVIAKVGVSYNPDETKKKLSKAKSVEELRSMWLSLSEDERRDQVIIEFAQGLKNNHEKV
jgi:hypothetical protein